MRKGTSVLLFSVSALALAAVPVLAGLNQFAGNWKNINPNTRGITALNIQVRGANVRIRGWGKCQPTDCDLGWTNAYAYASSVSSNLISNVKVLSAVFGTNSGQKLMIIRLVRGHLQVKVFTRFTDRSGRTNYEADYTFTRALMPWIAGLSVPRQIFPPNGTVFNHYPRRTTLRWKPVPGAVSYTVQIDCFHCCQTNRWCADVGRTWKLVRNLTTTSYTFEFIGAQPGRWRVWAVGTGGQKGPKSGWWSFRYTR